MVKANAQRHSRFWPLVAKWLPRVLPIPVLLLTWELVARLEVFNPQLFPAPSSAFWAMLEMARRGELLGDIVASVRRAAVGYVLGCLAGILIGMFTGRIALANKVFGQVAHIMRAFPPVAIVPFAITWFGLTESSKYFLVAWGVFFPVWVNTHAGMSGVDQSLVWAARSLGATRRYEISDVLLPAALPYVFAGMRVAIGICFICVFVAEMAGAYEGIGFRISTSYLVFRVDKMMASLILLGALGAGADRLFCYGTARAFPWIRLRKQ